MKAIFLLLGLFALGAAQAGGEYDEIARLRAMNRRVGGIRSMNDGEHYTVIEGEQRGPLRLCRGGRRRETAAPVSRDGIADYAFSPDERCLLVASGRTPIYRHSYTTKYYLSDGQTLEPVLPDAQSRARCVVLARRLGDSLLRPQRPLSLRHGFPQDGGG